jgi:hypothetical protein
MRDWLELFQEMDEGFREWRREHPKATLTEIERALDARWAKTRAVLLTDVAQASASADFAGKDAERPHCPACHVPVVARGKHERSLRTHGDRRIHLERDYGECPQCGEAFFPSG